MKKDNNVVYLHTYKLTYMKKNLRLIIAIILSGSCFISFFTQCIGTSKQQSPVVQASIEKNKAVQRRPKSKKTTTLMKTQELHILPNVYSLIKLLQKTESSLVTIQKTKVIQISSNIHVLM